MLRTEPQSPVWKQITLTDRQTNQIDKLVVREQQHNWVLESTNFPIA